MSGRRGRVTAWLWSWWVTYVQLSRADRRAIIAAVNDADHDFVEVERPAP